MMQYALIIYTGSINLNLGDTEVLLFESKDAAERFAVNVLVLAGLYAKSKKDGKYYSPDEKAFDSKADVLMDFRTNGLEDCEDFYVAQVGVKGGAP